MANGRPVKPMTQAQYETKREWIIDTAETPRDKANLQRDLAKLEREFRNSGGIKGAASKKINPLYK